jgi:hypothetical protein
MLTYFASALRANYPSSIARRMRASIAVSSFDRPCRNAARCPCRCPLDWYRRTEQGMLSSTNRFENSKINWAVYEAHIGRNLQYLVDLPIRNTLVGDDPA